MTARIGSTAGKRDRIWTDSHRCKIRGTLHPRRSQSEAESEGLAGAEAKQNGPCSLGAAAPRLFRCMTGGEAWGKAGTHPIARPASLGACRQARLVSRAVLLSLSLCDARSASAASQGCPTVLRALNRRTEVAIAWLFDPEGVASLLDCLASPTRFMPQSCARSALSVSEVQPRRAA